MPGELIRLLSFTIPTIVFIWGVFTWLRESRRKTEVERYKHLIDLYKKYSDSNILLNVHGIDEDELTKSGLSREEFYYILINFSIAELTNRLLDPDREDPFRENSYRYNLCKQSKMKLALPYLLQIMGDNHYTRRIKKTVEMTHS